MRYNELCDEPCEKAAKAHAVTPLHPLLLPIPQIRRVSIGDVIVVSPDQARPYDRAVRWPLTDGSGWITAKMDGIDLLEPVSAQNVQIASATAKSVKEITSLAEFNARPAGWVWVSWNN